MCGVIGVVSRMRDVIHDAIILTNAQNNRGEQSCGAATFDGKRLHYYYGLGKVSEVFGPRDQKRWVKRLVGYACTTHVLYSTIGKKDGGKQPLTQQPVIFKFRGKCGAISHNGNLVRLSDLREMASKKGYKFKSQTSDTEVISALISTSQKKNFLDALLDVLYMIEGKGSFTLVVLYEGKLYGVRDQNGNRPLCIIKKNGKGTDRDSYILASESSVFPALDATRLVRDVDVGEIVVIGPDGIERSIQWAKNAEPKFCVCELIYFANPATKVFGKSVYAFRVKAGEISAKNHPAFNADVVVPIPDSGRGYSDGFSSASGITNRSGLVKNRYTVRTFMQSRDVDRSSSQIAKLQALPDVMDGKNVILVEDSVFRASVAPAVIKMSREHGGARTIHLRVCSPPVCHKCHLGLDTSTNEELVASHMTVEQIRDNIIHSDSLEYLTVEELKQTLQEIGLNPDHFCLGCFTGEYPVEPTD